MANYQAGFNVKSRINSTAYAISRCNIVDECPKQDVTNTEGIAGNPNSPSNTPGYPGFIAAIKQFTANIVNATFDLLANPFTAPLNIISGNYIALRVFLNDVTGVSWQSNSFYVERHSHDAEVRALQPLTFSGAGDGFYSEPSA